MASVTIYDVGQANWTVVDFGNGQLAIVDCGAATIEDSRRVTRRIRQRLTAQPEARIAFVLISHLDADHISGITELLADETIAERIDAVICNDAELRALAGLVERMARERAKKGLGITKSTLSRAVKAIATLLRFYKKRTASDRDFHRCLVSPSGQNVADFPVEVKFARLPSNIRMFALAPSQRLRDDAILGLKLLEEDSAAPLDAVVGSIGRARWNAATIVLLIEDGTGSLLLPGDANRSTWAEILDRLGQQTLNADIVVAWHHGGSLGQFQGSDFDHLVWSRVLRTGHPTVIISHGGHRKYHHPDPNTIKCLRNLHAKVFCTRLKPQSDNSLPSIETAFPSKRFGRALDTPTASSASFYRMTPGACCGDLDIDLASSNLSSAAFGGSDASERWRNPNCCQAEGRRTNDVAGNDGETAL